MRKVARFRLLSLLAGVTLVAVVLATVREPLRQQRVETAIRATGGSIGSDHVDIGWRDAVAVALLACRPIAGVADEARVDTPVQRHKSSSGAGGRIAVSAVTGPDEFDCGRRHVSTSCSAWAGATPAHPKSPSDGSIDACGPRMDEATSRHPFTALGSPIKVWLSYDIVPNSKNCRCAAH